MEKAVTTEVRDKFQHISTNNLSAVNYALSCTWNYWKVWTCIRVDVMKRWLN